MGCVVDAALGSPVCESPCTAENCEGAVIPPGQLSGPFQTSSSCLGGYCQLNACAVTPGGADAGGNYNGPCTVVSPNDGTCYPTGLLLPDSGYGQTWGICLQGTPTGSCEERTLSCPAGAFCIAGDCRVPCDPTVAGGCDAGTCQPFPAAQNPHAGYCGPVCSLDGQTPCAEACCSPASICLGQATTDGGYCGPGE
jgi:hypothetical protein